MTTVTQWESVKSWESRWLTQLLLCRWQKIILRKVVIWIIGVEAILTKLSLVLSNLLRRYSTIWIVLLNFGVCCSLTILLKHIIWNEFTVITYHWNRLQHIFGQLLFLNLNRSLHAIHNEVICLLLLLFLFLKLLEHSLSRKRMENELGNWVWIW